MNDNEKKGATWEQHKNELKDEQERASAWMGRRKDEVITTDDLHLWWQRKQELAKNKKNVLRTDHIW